MQNKQQIHFKIQGRPIDSTPNARPVAVQRCVDVCLEAKSSRRSSMCTDQPLLPDACPHLPGPDVAWQVSCCCCHVIFAQVAALSWWGPVGRCGDLQRHWPQPAIRAQKKVFWFGSCFELNQAAFWLFPNTVIVKKLEPLRHVVLTDCKKEKASHFFYWLEAESHLKRFEHPKFS